MRDSLIRSRVNLNNFEDFDDIVCINKLIDNKTFYGYTILNRTKHISILIDEYRLKSFLYKRQIKIKNLELSKDNKIIEKKDIYRIDLEDQFLYSLVQVKKKDDTFALGWRLDIVDSPVGNKLRCPNVYHGYPVISLRETFGEEQSYYNRDGQSSVLNRKNLDLSNMDVSNVINMEEMLIAENKIEKINMSTWDISNVDCMYRLFVGCDNLKELKLGNIKLTDEQISPMRITPEDQKDMDWIEEIDRKQAIDDKTLADFRTELLKNPDPKAIITTPMPDLLVKPEEASRAAALKAKFKDKYGGPQTREEIIKEIFSIPRSSYNYITKEVEKRDLFTNLRILEVNKSLYNILLEHYNEKQLNTNEDKIIGKINKAAILNVEYKPPVIVRIKG